MDPITKLVLAVAVAIMSYFGTLYVVGLLMKTWHDEIVFDNEVLTKECANYESDKRFLFAFPALVALVVSLSFYFFWYQYLPR